MSFSSQSYSKWLPQLINLRKHINVQNSLFKYTDPNFDMVGAENVQNIPQALSNHEIFEYFVWPAWPALLNRHIWYRSTHLYIHLFMPIYLLIPQQHNFKT